MLEDKVLILDDDRMILKLLTIVIEGLGFNNVTCFQDGRLALEKISVFLLFFQKKKIF